MQSIILSVVRLLLHILELYNNFRSKSINQGVILEPFVPGSYTALGVINVRSQMKTTPASNITGAYYNGVPFTVYQVYDEDASGIVWGRVSSRVGSDFARYVGLRVLNNNKAKLEVADQGQPSAPADSQKALIEAMDRLTAAIDRNTAVQS